MRRAARVDAVAPDLVKAIKAHDAEWLPWPGGPIDGFALYRGCILAVDFKSKGGTLTDSQSKLVAAGWPIWFCRTPEQITTMFGSVGRLVSR